MPNKKNFKSRPVPFILLWMLVALIAAQCTPSAPLLDTNIIASAEAIQTFVVQTATQRVRDYPDASSQLATAQAEATQVAENVQATMAAQSTLEASRLDATAQAFSGVRAELPFYGVDPSTEGHPGWIQPPFSLSPTSHNEFRFHSDYPETVAKNFVLSSKITWITSYGTSGCGYVFRANGNQQAPTQYIAIILRGRFLIFSVIVEGNLANVRPIFIDLNSFTWENGSTNTFTVVARDDKISFYLNQTLFEAIDPNDLPPYLYVLPVPPPPKVRTSEGERIKPLVLPETPLLPKHIAEESMGYYVQMLKDYVTEVQKEFSDYQDYLAGLIKDEENPETKETLINYQNTIGYNQSIFDQTAGVLLSLPYHRDQDLVLVPGFISFAAFNESGDTECRFDNNWLWILE